MSIAAFRHSEKTILGIDPGTKEMGLVVLRGTTLKYFGVRTLRNGTRPHDVIGQAKRIVLALIAQHQPEWLNPLCQEGASSRSVVLRVVLDRVIQHERFPSFLARPADGR